MKTNQQTAGAILADLCDEPELAAKVTSTANKTILIDDLVAVRFKSDFSQSEMAERLGWTPSKVSRFENKQDVDIKIGELIEYSQVLGIGLGVHLESPETNSATIISNCVTQINYSLTKLTKLAKNYNDDPDILQGILTFQANVLLQLVVDSQKHADSIMDNIQLLEPHEIKNIEKRDHVLQKVMA